VIDRDRGLTARHEAGHVAGEVMAGHVPASVTADWPEPTIAGQMTSDFSDYGVNRDTAPEMIVSILLGPLAAAEPGWPPEWPLDANAADRDVRQLAALADFLGLTEFGWWERIRKAREVASTPDFKRITGLVAAALMKVDSLDASQLRFLLGPDLLQKYDREAAPCSA
jgi:hypothetical protein